MTKIELKSDVPEVANEDNSVSIESVVCAKEYEDKSWA